jgi:hypothetical protein
MENNQPQQLPKQPEPRTYDEIPPSTHHDQDERQDYRDERPGYKYEGGYWPTYDQRPGRQY